jgi:DNA-binding transcriptional LysR family regulator
MELRHLRYLLVVAEELHFGRAAIRLNISQPPLSQQIRQLEEELGVRLFARTKREVRLTEAGSRLVAEAQQVLGRIDHLVSVAAQVGSGEIGSLSIGVPGAVNPTLIEALRLLAKQSPGVRVELRYMSTGEQMEALQDGQIIIGFLNMPVEAPWLTLEVVSREPLWLALPKQHPLTRFKKVSIEALAEEQVILFPRRVTPGLHDTITSMCRNAGFGLRVAHEVDSLVGGLTLVSAGLGISFCTPSVQRSWTDIAFRPIEKAPDVELAAAHRSDTVTPALETFLRVVRKVARSRTARRKH